MSSPYLEKILVGKVKQLGEVDAIHLMDKPWETGMFKESVKEKIWLSKTGLIGDEVADTENHGGVEKAIFAYPVSHYDEWLMELSHEDLRIGGMGENLAVVGLDEHSVCLGDIYQLGEAVIQVSQPRQPCWKPARRFRKLDFALRTQSSGRTGWYFRVLKEGFVQEKQEFQLLERSYPQWTISKCNEVMHNKKGDVQLTQELANCEALAESWKKTLNKRLTQIESSIEKRVYGPNKD